MAGWPKVMIRNLARAFTACNPGQVAKPACRALLGGKFKDGDKIIVKLEKGGNQLAMKADTPLADAS